LICTDPSPGSVAPSTDRVAMPSGWLTKSDEIEASTIIATSEQTTTTAVYAPARADGQRISTGRPV